MATKPIDLLFLISHFVRGELAQAFIGGDWDYQFVLQVCGEADAIVEKHIYLEDLPNHWLYPMFKAKMLSLRAAVHLKQGLREVALQVAQQATAVLKSQKEFRCCAGYPFAISFLMKVHLPLKQF